MPINYIGNDITVKYIDGRVEYFADLPLATENADKVYIVEKASGIIFINRHKAGLYYSNGTSWEYMPNSVQADFVLYNNATSLLTATDVQAAIDEMRTVPAQYHGVVTLPTITDNLDGSVAIGAGVANFSVTANGDGAIVRLATPAADPVALTDGSVNYVYADYNAGSPTIAVALTPNGFLADGRLIPMFRVIREGTDLHILDYDDYAVGLSDKLFFKNVALNAFERSTGLVLSTAATRISTVSAGSAWFGVQLYTLAENVAGTTGELEYYYPVAGVWTKTTVTAYDSTYYSDGTNRQTLGVAKYVAKYFFRGVETDNHVYYISGNQKNSAAGALAEAVPAAPSVITSHSLYVGKIVIKQGATNGTAYPRQWEGTVSTAGAVNHNDLANRDAAGSHATFTPLADSTTAFQFFKADGTTPVLQIDTTNELIRCKTYMSGSDDVLRLKNDASTATLSIYDDGTADLTATDNILVYDTVSNFNWLELDRVVGMTVSKSGAQSILGANYLQLNSGTFVTEMESGLISYDGTEVLGFTDTALTIYPSVIKPDADSTTAFQFTKADGTTAVLTLDTTNAITKLNGNVGIGTTPSYKLHLADNTDGAYAVVISQASAIGFGLAIYGASTSGGQILFKVYNDSFDAVKVYGDGDTYFYGDVSAASFTDRTPYPKDYQTALDAVMSMERLPDGEYDENDKEHQLNHDKLHVYVKNGNYRDMSATVSCLVEVVKEMRKELNELKGV